MIHSLFGNSIPIFELILRGTVVYLFVLALLRFSGKREMGQLTAIELVAILLISNAVQNAMNGGDNSLIGGLVLAATIIALSTVIAIFGYRHRKFRHLLEGTPTLLIRHGVILEQHLKKELITHEELVHMLRRQGIKDISTIDVAILESGGTLSIIQKAENREPIEKHLIAVKESEK